MTAKFIAYLRVSTAEQGASGLGLDAQGAAIAAHVSGCGGDLLASYVEIESGKRNDRPKLREALDHCKLTGARLVVAKLDRLGRKLRLLADLMEGEVGLVVCDQPGASSLLLHILGAIAEEEARTISLRTKGALGSIKAKLDKGEAHTSRRSGRQVARLGNPRGLSVSRPDLGAAAVVAKADAHATKVGPMVQTLRASGLSYAAIAERLTADRVETPRGGAWTPMGVKRVMERSCSLC